MSPAREWGRGGVREWARRVAIGLAVGVGVVLVAAVLDEDPEPVRVLLLSVVVVLVVGVLSDSLTRSTARWYPESSHHLTVTRGRDPVTQAHLRVLENHQSTRHPDELLQQRLRMLADRVLQNRYGVAADSPRGRELMGPDLDEVVHGRVVRLSPRRTDHLLRQIEEL
jgi:hypothetical protein